jgi:hypothetical protein
MFWAGAHPRRGIRPRKLTETSPYPYLTHWAGRKQKLFWRMRNGRLPRHFERLYYTRITGGRRTRLRRSARQLAAILAHREPSTTKPPPR